MTSLGSVREVSAEGGGGSVCLGKVLPRGGTNDDDIWGRYLGAVGCNVKKLEGIHVGFLKQVTGEKTRIKNGRYWWRAKSYNMLQEVGMQPLQTYIDRIQETVEDWLALRTILEVCAK